MNMIPLENKPLESFTQEQREKLGPFIGSRTKVETAKYMARIHAACGKDIDRATRLIQEGMPTGIITYPDFVIQKDDFLDLFVVKSKSDQNKPALEVAIVAAVHGVCKSLDDTDKVIDNLGAMGFKLIETSDYKALLQKTEQAKVDAEMARSTLSTFENRINALKEVLNRAVTDDALVPGTSLFNDLVKYMGEFIPENKGFREFVAKAIEMHIADVLREDKGFSEILAKNVRELMEKDEGFKAFVKSLQ